jgi:hypothetical protein
MTVARILFFKIPIPFLDLTFCSDLNRIEACSGLLPLFSQLLIRSWDVFLKTMAPSRPLPIGRDSPQISVGCVYHSFKEIPSGAVPQLQEEERIHSTKSR